MLRSLWCGGYSNISIQMKNKVGSTFLLTLLTVTGLFALHELPLSKWTGLSLRKVDLLSDIRNIPDIMSDTVSLPTVVMHKPTFVDTCRQGMTCIEDYADSTGHGMNSFYSALTNIKTLNRPVRIAYFGDSFIEGDILVGYLRQYLQTRYGGCGVGYVSMHNPNPGFRPTVLQQSGGWQSHTVTDTCCFSRANQDISNRYFIPKGGSWTQLSTSGRTYTTVDSCSMSICYFMADDTVQLTARINHREEIPFTVVGDSSLTSLSVKGNIRNVRWKVENIKGKALFYAVTMESEQGIIVDNFSLRGSSGQQLRNVGQRIMRQEAHLRPYDLIIFHYGPNIASPRVRDYSYYTKSMSHVIEQFKSVYPTASILIVGCSDRAAKNEYGELTTMPGVKYLIRYQQAMAAEAHVAFWNLFEAMGGDGSMVQMVEKGEANLDYTHINFKGGKHLAKLFFDVLEYGHTQYLKRKEYEAH